MSTTEPPAEEPTPAPEEEQSQFDPTTGQPVPSEEAAPGEEAAPDEEATEEAESADE